MPWDQRIGKRLKLRDLHILLMVVQCGNMSKAARQLSVSNPVVTKSIADLDRISIYFSYISPWAYGQPGARHELYFTGSHRISIYFSYISPWAYGQPGAMGIRTREG